MRTWSGAVLVATACLGAGCSASDGAGGASLDGSVGDARAGGDAGGVNGGAWDAGSGMAWIDGALGGDPPLDASKPTTDSGAFAQCDAAALPPDRFITQVVSFEAGACGGFGEAEMPAIIEGPPVGGGESQGGTDVLSLGTGGSIVVAFTPNAIVDGPGADFIVFENAFEVAGNPANIFAEPGEVSVSDDGITWTTFPCMATQAPWGACAGTHPVLSNPDDCVSPVDPSVAGGDPYDLHDVGVTHATYVRIVDKTNEACGSLTTNGFDLDAVSIVNAASAQ